MKRLLMTFSIVVLATLNAFTQEVDTLEIRKDVSKYFVHNEGAEWDSLITMLIPEFVELLTPEMLRTQMEQLANNPNFDVSFRDMKVHKIHNAFEHEDAAYALVDHEFIMQFDFKQSEDQTAEEFKTFVEFMEMSFQTQYKGQEVKMDPESNSILVKPLKTSLAVKKADYDTWKFIDYEPQNEMIYNMIFSEEVVKILKEKFEKEATDD